MTYETKKQQRERFLAEFLQRIREAPPGTRVYRHLVMILNKRVSTE